MISHKTKLIFIRVPRVASKSIFSRKEFYLTYVTLNGARIEYRHCAAVKCLKFPAYSENWDHYFKFGVVRNPWDRMVSLYSLVYHGAKKAMAGNARYSWTARVKRFTEVCRRRGVPSFDGMLDTWEEMSNDQVEYHRIRLHKDGYPMTVTEMALRRIYFLSQYQMLCDGEGKILVDYVGRFEDLGEVSRRLGKHVGKKISFPVVNCGKHSHYTKYYNDARRKRVASICEQEIDLFKYTFGKGLK